VDTAIDGQHFLDVMTNPSNPKTYDLITLDNYMPVLSGEQAIQKFRELGRTEFVVGMLSDLLF
jgi:DNA-binding response OmpR family regulator